MSAAVSLVAGRCAGDRAELALVRLLERLVAAVDRMPAQAYTARPADRVSGSVGEHVRHCLDHVGALTTIATSTRLTYDRRHRGTDVERDPTSAVKETLRLIDDVRRLSAFPSTSPVTVESILERGGIAISSRSTLARELAFVVQHTIHHLAIVALLLDRLGLSFDDNLSVAPSTPPRH